MTAFLHVLSGKVFWLTSAYLPLSHPIRAWVERALLWFYRWETVRNPRLADAYSKIASLLANQDKPDQAVAYYTRALETNHPDPGKIQYFMGRQKVRCGDKAGAVECFREFVRLSAEARGIPSEHWEKWRRVEDDPEFDLNHFHGFLYLAMRSRESGLHAQATEWLRTSITLEPLVIRAHTELAEVLYASNREEEALNVVRSAHCFHLRQSHPHIGITPQWRKYPERPDFMILGKSKCGTTSLYRYLTQHPCIVPALAKELEFFTRRYNRGVNWYLTQFPPIGNHPELITGEASADYIDSDLVASRIHRDFPDTRFIVLLRDPVQRTVSHYNMNVRFGLESAPIDEAVLKGVDPSLGDASLNEYVDRSLYRQSLEAWMSLFPREQFLVLSSEELFASPSKVTNQAYRFLGQEPFISNEYPVENRGYTPAVAPDLQRKLREFFAPHNRALEELLGMRFGWDD